MTGRNERRERPIGIFDSGVGGLTVVSEFLKELPDESIIYFGDTARVPYGSKSKEIVTKYSTQIVNFLLSRDVKVVVAACGTVSSNSFEDFTRRFDIPMLGVVSSGAAQCAASTKNNIVGVIGTQRTVSSGAYERLITALNPDIKVYSKACPLFVPLAEEGWADNDVSLKTAEIYLGELARRGIDTLVLGCTHYPLLIDTIKKTVGEGINIINPASATAVKAREMLEETDLLSNGGAASRTFYVSDGSGRFNEICALVLSRKYDAEIIDIERF